jgi:hypothetical protein
LSPLVAAPPEPTRATRSPRGRTASRTPTPRKPARTDRPTATCPRCFMALPATGICDNCD